MQVLLAAVKASAEKPDRISCINRYARHPLNQGAKGFGEARLRAKELIDAPSYLDNNGKKLAALIEAEIHFMNEDFESAIAAVTMSCQTHLRQPTGQIATF